MRPLPDTAPVIAALDTLILQGISWTQSGLNPEQGMDCAGLIHYAYGLAGITLPSDPAAAQHVFVPCGPPFQAWDVLMGHTFLVAAPRHLVLVLALPWAYHIMRETNGLARLDITSGLWRKLHKAAWRFQEFL